MKPVLRFFLIMVIGLGARNLMASDADEDVAEVARQRLYPGGVDEQDLKVQDTMDPPKRKYSQRQVQEQVLRGLSSSESISEENSEED